MQKKLIKLALISSILIPQMQAWGGSDDQNAAAGSLYLRIQSRGHHNQSRESFLDFMGDTLLNQAYLNAQKMRLKTVGDISLEGFLDASPMMQKLVPGLRAQFLADLKSTTSGNLLEEFLITKKSNPRLYHQLMRVMRAQGFSRKQMARAKFFRKMGEVNADAYTASVDGVGFELLTGLDDIATPSELRGVMGHELGHIRSGHVFIGVLDSVLQIQVVKQLSASDSGAMSMAELRAWEKIRDDMAAKAIARLGARFKINADEMSDAFMMMMKNTDETISKSFSGEQRATVLQQYLDLKISTYEKMEINASDIALLKAYRDDMGVKQIRKANLDQATQLFEKVVTPADSRNMESSADAFGNIVVRPSRAAMMDAVFAGGEIKTRLTSSQVQDLVQFMRDQVNLDRKLSTRAEYYNKIGGVASSDHPFSALRVLKQAAFDQHIDRIALANPFLNHIVLRDAVLTEIEKRKQNIVELQFAMTLSKQEREGNPQVKAIIQGLSISSLNALLKKNSTELSGYQERLPQIEMQISDLLMDSRFSKGNPRVLNLLDMRLAELMMAQIELVSFEESLKGGFASTLSAQERAEVLARLQGLVELSKQDTLLLKAVAALENEVALLSQQEPGSERFSKRKEILFQVKAALAPDASLNHSYLARVEMRSLTKSPDRISLNKFDSGPKNSNTEWDPSAPAFKDETQNAKARACRALFK